MRSILFLTCLLYTSANYGQSKDTFEVYFPFNVSKLSKETHGYIDKLIFNNKLLHSDKLIVLGYADFVGGSGYNDTLSKARATRVRNYLIASGFDEQNIKLCIGKGKIARQMTTKDGYAPDRKVQIIIDREAMKQVPPETTTDTFSFVPGGDWAKVKVNQVFLLNNIYFKLNQPVLLPTSEGDLQKLLDFLQRFPSVKIQVEGHVCCMGPTEGVDSKYKGRNLSECRAEAVYNYLAEKGISKERMKFVGLGNNNPIVRTEMTEADRQKNRRVEIRILSK